MLNSFTEENYLKAIYKLAIRSGKVVSTNALAERLDTKASSVTDMIKRLAGKKLVNYKKYQGVTLSKRGQQIAIDIIRKHRLWEVFLVDHLGFGWDEVHDVAALAPSVKTPRHHDDEVNDVVAFAPHGRAVRASSSP